MSWKSTTGALLTWRRLHSWWHAVNHLLLISSRWAWTLGRYGHSLHDLPLGMMLEGLWILCLQSTSSFHTCSMHSCYSLKGLSLISWTKTPLRLPSDHVPLIGHSLEILLLQSWCSKLSYSLGKKSSTKLTSR